MIFLLLGLIVVYLIIGLVVMGSTYAAARRRDDREFLEFFRGRYRGGYFEMALSWPEYIGLWVK